MPGPGVIIDCTPSYAYKNARVAWDGGKQNYYRIGAENSFDLYYGGNNQLFITYYVFRIMFGKNILILFNTI